MRSLSSRGPKDSRATRCPNCGKRRLLPADDITSEIEGYTFVEQGLRCAACGEEYIAEEDSQRMIRVARRLGIWGEPLKLRRKLSRSGRGTVLRIPTDIERSLRLRGDEEILVSKAGKKIIIELSP
jgi:DNA-directed RNA polymerase subunit RPC12/RpoP